MSEVRSFGSNCNRHSQSRKISIGVMVESSAKIGPKKGQDGAVPTVAGANRHHRDSIDGAHVTTSKAKQIEPLEQPGSPWITTKSNHEKSTNSPTASHAKVIFSKLKNRGMNDEPNGFKGGTSDHSVKIFPTRTSILQSGDFFEGISDGPMYRRNGEKHGNSQIELKFPCTIAQEPEALTSKIGDKAETTVKGKSEVLRMKLWEILGTVSSPNKERQISQMLEVDGNYPQPDVDAKQAGATAVKSTQNVDKNEVDGNSPQHDAGSKQAGATAIRRSQNSGTIEVNGDPMQPNVDAKQAGATAVRRRQNSDTIETDSESPDCVNKRPVTRSLARKRASTKSKQETVQRGGASTSRQKLGESNIFSFQEGWYIGMQGAANGGSTTCNRSNTGSKGSRVEPSKVSVQRRKHDKSQQLSSKKQNPLATDKACSGGSRGGSLLNVQSHVTGNNACSKGPSADKYLPKQTTSKPAQDADNTSPAFPEHWDQREDVGNSSLENVVNSRRNSESQYPQRKNAGIEKHKFSVHLKRSEHRIGQVSDENEVAPAAAKSVTHGSNANAGGFHGDCSNANKLSIDPKITNIEKDLPVHPETSKVDQQEDINSPEEPRHQSQGEEDINSPALPEHQSQRGDIGNLSFKGTVDPEDGAGSPTFGRRSPIASHSLGSRRRVTREQQQAHCPAEPEFMSSGRGIFSFGNFTSKFAPNSNGMEELQDSPPRSPDPQMQENDVENRLPCSSSEDTGSESFEEGPGAKAFSPEIGTAEKPKFMLRRTKRLRSFEGIQHQGCSPTSVSPKVTTENHRMRKLQEQNVVEEEDDLTRAIAILALALEKLKSKVKLLTTKKSSEILTSVAERIRAQMQSVESQIQKDTYKLTSLSKQKRKNLETEFQEKEEQIKAIHGNFKKEISQLLEDCKGTIEGLEDNQIELKEIVDKQKASHQKLISQVQDAVETQLHDAEKRIATINQSAREQMLQLKLVIAECLE